MKSCTHSLVDDSFVSFCLWNLFLWVWVVRMYWGSFQCRNWLNCWSKLIITMDFYHMETPNSSHTYYKFNGESNVERMCWSEISVRKFLLFTVIASKVKCTSSCTCTNSDSISIVLSTSGIGLVLVVFPLMDPTSGPKIFSA